MAGRSFSNNSYKYGWNGKETEKEIFEGCITFEARIYNSHLCRFLSTDPRESEYPWQSTYVYFSNSPISVLDFMGMGANDNKKPPRDKKAEKRRRIEEKNRKRLERNQEKAKPYYDQMRKDNPQEKGQSNKAYENSIISKMLETYGTKKWMYSKINSVTGDRFRYILVPATLAPIREGEESAEKLDLAQAYTGPGVAAWELDGNSSNVSMTITNSSANSPITLDRVTYSIGDGTVNELAIGLIISKGNAKTLTFNSQNKKGLLYVNYTTTADESGGITGFTPSFNKIIMTSITLPQMVYSSNYLHKPSRETLQKEFDKIGKKRGFL